MADLGKKISELAETTDLTGLYTIGTDRNTQSKKVSLQFLKEAANYANAQGDYAKLVGDTVAGNVGVNDYPLFNSSQTYTAGDVVRYNERLYCFIAPHSGEWNGADAILTSINAELKKQFEKKEDLSSSLSKGYYTYSSLTIGSQTTASKNSEGTWRCIAQPVVAGEKYYITGAGGAGARLYCLVDASNRIISIADADQKSDNLEISVQVNGILYCSFNISSNYSLILAKSKSSILENMILGLDSKVEDIKNIAETADVGVKNIETILQITEQVEDLSSSLSKGYYTYSSLAIGSQTTASKDSDGSWRCVAQPVVAGEKYYITGVGGGGARLYCLVDASNRIISIADAGQQSDNLEVVVGVKGILYCSFNASYSYQLIRKYYAANINIDPAWKSGSFQFGKTCDCDYTAPNISPYNFPSAGKVNYIYGLYDDLVARYPKYVFKEDCDSVIQALGVEKPAAIADLPMYIYKFMPPKAPNSSGYYASDSEANMIKALVLTGTHPEYTAVWDCYNAMRLICEEWDSDKNLEELRWNAEIYIIPCYNMYGVENVIRTNENGVDLNRNAPTKKWKVQGSYGDNTYSGESAGSEYSTKVMIHYLSTIQPHIFIDHHNTNVGAGSDDGDGKNMMYVHSVNQIAVDLSSVLISQMTRKWKKRFPETFPSVEADPTTLFGYALYDHIEGSIGKYGSEQGALGSTFETNFGTLYKDGIFSTDNRRNNTELVNTCATEGFVNYLLRSLKAYSDYIGVHNTL